eukprot:COSAG05_NODE_1039_length_6069_cov_34.005999_2_plen_115_part_00
MGVLTHPRPPQESAVNQSLAVMHALFDSVHLLGNELSELERQKDDLVVRGMSKDDSFTTTRPRAEPTKTVKDLSALQDHAKRLRQAACGGYRTVICVTYNSAVGSSERARAVST